MFLCHVFMQKVIVKNILDINEEFVVSKGTSLVSSFLKIITKSRSAEISQGVRMCHTILGPVLLLPGEPGIKF